jgi:hypothetical protein
MSAGALAAVVQRRHVVSYTFGCPRVGNKAFSKEYNKTVPHSFRVVNENDRVVWIGHCRRVHGGREVIVNRDGDCCVDANMIESIYKPVVGQGASVKNHLLTRYANSLDNALCARNRNLLPNVCSFLYEEQHRRLPDCNDL